jgi:transcriptional regulator with XRE-family HTH domain
MSCPRSPMPPGPVSRTSAASRRQLGTELRQLREKHSLLLEDIATRLDVAPSTISRIETGKAPTRTSYLHLMLDMYHVTDPHEQQWLTELARDGQAREWAAPGGLLHPTMIHYLGLEAAAAHISLFALQTVPELLQTPQYAQAAIRAEKPGLDETRISELTQVTLHRQQLAATGKARIHAILDEAALLRPAGSPQVMTGQLEHLRALTAAGNIRLDILALATPWPVLTAPFTILGFPKGTGGAVACSPGAAGAVRMTSHGPAVRALRSTFQTLIGSAMPAAETAWLVPEPGGHGRQ